MSRGASNLSWAPVSPPHLPSLLSGCVTLDRSPYHLPSLSSSRELQILTRSLERSGEAPGPEAAVVLTLGGPWVASPGQTHTPYQEGVLLSDPTAPAQLRGLPLCPGVASTHHDRHTDGITYNCSPVLSHGLEAGSPPGPSASWNL